MSTGALNPAHQGHVEMLRQAAQRLQEAEYSVVCAYVSPSHDHYVQDKAARYGMVGLTQDFRLQLARLMTENDPLVDASSWEVDQHTFVDFPQVAAEFDTWASKNIPSEVIQAGLATSADEVKIRTFYVCGTDHAFRCRLDRGMTSQDNIGVVIVPRAGEQVPQEREARHVYVSKPASGDVAGYSSTKVRDAIRGKDWRSVSSATSPEVARFLSQPVREERDKYPDDFKKLGV